MVSNTQPKFFLGSVKILTQHKARSYRRKPRFVEFKNIEGIFDTGYFHPFRKHIFAPRKL